MSVVKTSWFRATTPIVGISSATNSSLRDAEDDEIRDEIFAELLRLISGARKCTSSVDAIKAMTPTKSPHNIPQSRAAKLAITFQPRCGNNSDLILK
jgi:hypothetical protein